MKIEEKKFNPDILLKINIVGMLILNFIIYFDFKIVELLGEYQLLIIFLISFIITFTYSALKKLYFALFISLVSIIVLPCLDLLGNLGFFAYFFIIFLCFWSFLIYFIKGNRLLSYNMLIICILNLSIFLVGLGSYSAG